MQLPWESNKWPMLAKKWVVLLREWALTGTGADSLPREIMEPVEYPLGAKLSFIYCMETLLSKLLSGME